MSIMNIEVLAGGKRYRFQSEAGTSLKDCLLKAGILEGAECGGRGICGKCAVKVRSGTLVPVEGDESFLMTRGDGKVLACQSLIREDVVIEISAGRDDVRRKVRLPNLQKEKKYSDSLIEKKFIQAQPAGSGVRSGAHSGSGGQEQEGGFQPVGRPA